MGQRWGNGAAWGCSMNTTTDVGVYGLLSGFRMLHVDRDKGVARMFTYMDNAELDALANRAKNVVEGASTALHAVGDLLMAHDKTFSAVPSVDVGAAITMLVDLLDGALLIASDARSESEERLTDKSSAPSLHVVNPDQPPAA